MQLSKYLKMKKSELENEIIKTEQKIKNLKEHVSLLNRLKESAKVDSSETAFSQNNEMEVT